MKKITVTLKEEDWNIILSSLEGLKDECCYDVESLIKKIESVIR